MDFLWNRRVSLTATEAPVYHKTPLDGDVASAFPAKSTLHWRGRDAKATSGERNSFQLRARKSASDVVRVLLFAARILIATNRAGHDFDHEGGFRGSPDGGRRAGYRGQNAIAVRARRGICPWELETSVAAYRPVESNIIDDSHRHEI